MESFQMKLARLKEELGVSEDQLAAKALGISKAALSDRKRRQSFPDEKVFALAHREPELKIDPTYVMTGRRMYANQESVIADGLLAAATETGRKEVRELAAAVVKSINDQNIRRADTYRLLRDLAGHCDDQQLDLLCKVAESFVDASITRSKRR